MPGVLTIVAVGILVSGGSGFWNKIVGYVGAVRDVKKEDAEKTEAEQLQQNLRNLQDIDTAKQTGLIDDDTAKKKAASLKAASLLT